MRKAIGLFRPLRFDHLDLTAKLLVKYSISDTFDILNDVLAKEFKGKEGRRKIINNLTRVWSGGKKEPSDFQKKVLELYVQSHNKDKIVYQYLMTSLAYPFFIDTVEYVGKYLRMSDDIKSSTILAEIRNLYGGSEAVYKGVNSVINGLIDWKLLKTKDNKKGLFISGEKIEIYNQFQKNLLVLSLLNNSNRKYLTLEEVNAASAYFPFDYFINTDDIDLEMIEILHERLGDYVSLKDNSTITK